MPYSGDIIFSGHAFQRMFERQIDAENVLEVIRNGEIIADYPDDTPFPSRLYLGFPDGKPVHVVAGYDEDADTIIIITVYHPDTTFWDDAFRIRRI